MASHAKTHSRPTRPVTMNADCQPQCSVTHGTISGVSDYSRDTVATATATGTLRLHGVDRTVTCSGALEIRKGVISLRASFRVALEDYHIPVPKLLTQSIADTVDVRVVSVYIPYQK